ncbi:MAG: hypothetical protein P9X24_18485, partial [Candidatus Hatepunaea meridiana]|nr:hypothetical protein [Candidatus Hatepunaea meridiana]
GARMLFTTAIQKDQTYIDAQRNYAELLLMMEDYDNGVQAYMTILKNQPDDVLSLIKIAQLYTEVGEKEKAKGYAEEALKFDPENTAALEFA